MNWTQIEGKWDQLKGDLKSNWAKLTDDDIKAIGGRIENLMGKLVERYGLKREQAQEQIDQWTHSLSGKIDAAGRHIDARNAEDKDEQAAKHRS